MFGRAEHSGKKYDCTPLKVSFSGDQPQTGYFRDMATIRYYAVRRMIRCSNQIASRNASNESGALNLGTVPLTDAKPASARSLVLRSAMKIDVGRFDAFVAKPQCDHRNDQRFVDVGWSESARR